MITPEDLEKSAPRPWSTLDIGCTRGIQTWVVDANGRKIIQVFGRANEKAFTGALIVEAVNAIEAAPSIDASIEDIAAKMRTLHGAMETAGFRR